jgi:hypothetical protein
VWAVVEIEGERLLPEYGYFVAFNSDPNQGYVGLVFGEDAYPIGCTYGQAIRITAILNAQISMVESLRQ